MRLLLLLFLLFPSLAARAAYEYPVTVVDETGQPMIGVSIYTPDYRIGTSTDLDGRALLKDVAYNEVLHFSYTGYQELKLPFFELRKRGGRIVMQPVPETLETLVVVGRRDEDPAEIPYEIKNIAAAEIAALNSQTVADALRDAGGVYVQKSQMGGGSPVLRGFEANRVLLVLDGVRMNNAIYRDGHLQNSITIDPNALERLEVIYGPGSLTYGSDALGGVIHMRTRDPQLVYGNGEGNTLLTTNAYVRTATANREKTAHADVNYGTRKWGSFTSFTFTDYQNLRAGRNFSPNYPDFGRTYYFAQRRDGLDQVFSDRDSTFNTQYGTEYTQLDFLQKVKFQPSETFYTIFNFQLSSTSDVPRFDQLSRLGSQAGEPKFIEWYYGPQRRLLASAKLRWLKANRLFDRATLIPAFQRIDEDRIQRKFRKTERAKSLTDVFVSSLTADFDKYLGGKRSRTLSYGVDFQHNDVASTAFNELLGRGTVIYNELPRYPGGGSTLTSSGAYANYKHKGPDSTWTLNAGLRYSFTRLTARFLATDPIAWPANFVEGLTNQNSALTGGLGLTYRLPGRRQLRAMTGTAYRSPNVDDFAKIREKNGRVTIPNVDLQPERSWTSELTLSQTTGSPERPVTISATGYYTRLRNAVVREPLPVPGTVDQFTLVLPPNDTLEVLANVNSSTAFVVGGNIQLAATLSDRWGLEAGINYTRGRRRFQRAAPVNLEGEIMPAIDTLVPYAHIPPVYGQAVLRYAHRQWEAQAVVRYNGAKPVAEYAVTDLYYGPSGTLEVDREGNSDNLVYSYFVLDENGKRDLQGTPAWATFNFYSTYRFAERFSLDLAVENIFDLHYRPFSSGVSAPGRNFIVALRGAF